MSKKKALERLKRKMTVENLWLYVIASLLKGPTYAYDIRKRIRELFGFDPSPITLYAVVYKLKRDGFIKIVSEQPKMYGATEDGVEALRDAVKVIEDNLSRLKRMLKGNE